MRDARGARRVRAPRGAVARAGPRVPRGRRAGCAAPRAAAAAPPRPKLKGSIGEGSNHSNFSDQSSVRIQEILFEFIRN